MGSKIALGEVTLRLRQRAACLRRIRVASRRDMVRPLSRERLPDEKKWMSSSHSLERNKFSRRASKLQREVTSILTQSRGEEIDKARHRLDT